LKVFILNELIFGFPCGPYCKKKDNMVCILFMFSLKENFLEVPLSLIKKEGPFRRVKAPNQPFNWHEKHPQPLCTLNIGGLGSVLKRWGDIKFMTGE
jgi:hypothetical protein